MKTLLTCPECGLNELEDRGYGLIFCINCELYIEFDEAVESINEINCINYYSVLIITIIFIMDLGLRSLV